MASSNWLPPRLASAARPRVHSWEIDAERNRPVQSRSASAYSGSRPRGLRHPDPTGSRTGHRRTPRLVYWPRRSPRRHPLRVDWGGMLDASMAGLEGTHDGIPISPAPIGALCERPKVIWAGTPVHTAFAPSSGSLVWSDCHSNPTRSWVSHWRHRYRCSRHCVRPSGSHSLAVDRIDILGSSMDDLQQKVFGGNSPAHSTSRRQRETLAQRTHVSSPAKGPAEIPVAGS